VWNRGKWCFIIFHSNHLSIYQFYYYKQL